MEIAKLKDVFLTSLIFIVLLAGCTLDDSADFDPPSAVGSDRDEHGCIGSAGYQWCARTGKCERPWELAEKAEFTNTPSNFEAYCAD
jgi:hypothetical protein